MTAIDREMQSHRHSSMGFATLGAMVIFIATAIMAVTACGAEASSETSLYRITITMGGETKEILVQSNLNYESFQAYANEVYNDPGLLSTRLIKAEKARVDSRHHKGEVIGWDTIQAEQ